MKILIISDAWHPQVNGVVRTYENLIPELENLGHTAQVIGPSDFKFTIPFPGYKEIKLSLLPHRALAKKIATFNPDTIHIATEGPLGFAAQKICEKRGLKFSTCYHTHFPDYLKARLEKVLLLKPFPKVIEKIYQKSTNRLVEFHNHASCVLATTPSIIETLQSHGVKTPCTIFTRGMRKDLFIPAENTAAREQILERLYPNIKRPIALYVGRIAIEKNLKDFLKAPWQGTKIILGEGPDRASLKRKYRDAKFVGKKERDELALHYKTADIFVFPSKTDTFGMVNIEALGCGLPVAAYPVQGPKDIITQSYLGALNDNLVDAINDTYTLSQDETLRAKRSRYAHEHYSWQTAAQQFIDACPTIDKKQA